MSETETAIPGGLPRQLPVLPLKGTVVFPGAMAPLSIGEERSIRLVDDVVDSTNRMIVLVAARDSEATEPGPELLHEVGTVAVVQRMLKVPDGTLRILAQGADRASSPSPRSGPSAPSASAGPPRRRPRQAAARRASPDHPR